MLSNGWILFHFLSVEDRDAIESRFWVIGRGLLVLSKWYPSFDPRKEKLLKRHLWVLLPGLLLQCWLLKGFTAIANSIGRLIMIEDDLLYGSKRRTPQVLVEIDASKGLLSELEVIWDGGSFIQPLDYWKVLFRCHGCHEVGHPKQRCHSRLLKVDDEGKGRGNI